MSKYLFQSLLSVPGASYREEFYRDKFSHGLGSSDHGFVNYGGSRRLSEMYMRAQDVMGLQKASGGTNRGRLGGCLRAPRQTRCGRQSTEGGGKAVWLSR